MILSLSSTVEAAFGLRFFDSGSVASKARFEHTGAEAYAGLLRTSH
jgi:hypothetical protein